MAAALFPLRRTLAIVLIGLLAAAVPAGDAPPKAGGPGKPLSPQEAQKQFRLDPGLRIELVAAEPTIQSPVAMTFDPQGRIWVVEMQDYPNGPAKGEKPRGRIRILEDKDGDGYYESATTFADNLLFANGLFLWKDGAIVTMAPHIVHLRDTDGDGKADKTEVLYEGFAAQNPQLRVSHPILGLDGWVYCANGLRGGKAIRAADPKAKPVDLSGMDFRFDPVTGAYEAITGMGQYGNTFDEWGNRFVCDNRHHLRHIVMESRYLKRNPYLAAPSLVQDVSVLGDGPLGSGGKIYPLSRNWTTSSLHEGRFTAACSVFIYHGNLLDQASLPRKREEDWKYHGAAFTCDPTGNLVHMEILTPKGATFTSKPPRQGVEFLATPDDWFRPVFLTHGPDGAMYVVDMYRAVIEHPQFMPPELQKRPDLTRGRAKGRIWRIVPEKHLTKAIRPNLAKASIAELVKTLDHPEPWWRTTAQRLLLEKNDKTTLRSLPEVVEKSDSPHANIVAAWLLERHGELSDPTLKKMAVDRNPRVREHALRLIEPRIRKNLKWFDVIEDIYPGEKGYDARVGFQAALTVGAGLDRIDDYSGAVLAGLVTPGGSEDPWMRLAVQTAVPKAATYIIFYATRHRSAREYPDYSRILRQEAAIVASLNDLDDYLEAFRITSVCNDTAGFVGLAEGLERRGRTLATVVKDLPESKKKSYAEAVEKVFADAATHARHSGEPTDQRMLCLRLMSQAPWATARQTLIPIVEKDAAQQVRIAALRACSPAGQGSPATPPQTLAQRQPTRPPRNPRSVAPPSGAYHGTARRDRRQARQGVRDRRIAHTAAGEAPRSGDPRTCAQAAPGQPPRGEASGAQAVPGGARHERRRQTRPGNLQEKLRDVPSRRGDRHRRRARHCGHAHQNARGAAKRHRGAEPGDRQLHQLPRLHEGRPRADRHPRDGDGDQRHAQARRGAERCRAAQGY